MNNSGLPEGGETEVQRLKRWVADRDVQIAKLRLDVAQADLRCAEADQRNGVMMVKLWDAQRERDQMRTERDAAVLKLQTP